MKKNFLLIFAVVTLLFSCEQKKELKFTDPTGKWCLEENILNGKYLDTDKGGCIEIMEIVGWSGTIIKDSKTIYVSLVKDDKKDSQTYYLRRSDQEECCNQYMLKCSGDLLVMTSWFDDKTVRQKMNYRRVVDEKTK